MELKQLEKYIGTLSKDEALNIERYNYLENAYKGLTEENKNIFKAILKSGNVLYFQDIFKEKDFNELLSLYEGEFLKDNFLYISAIISCLKKYQPIFTKEDMDFFKEFSDFMKNEN